MIKIYGISDDVVVVDGDCRGEVHDGTSIHIGGNDGGLVIAMHYADVGSGNAPVWQARVRQIDENYPIPWAVTLGTAPPNGHPKVVYSVMVTVDCPPDTPITGGKFSRGS